MRVPAVALLALALAATVQPALAAGEAAPARPHVEKTFLIPSEEGYGVGECLAGGPSECGQVVANAWCESQGYASATTYGVAAQDEYTGAIAGAPIPAPTSPRPLRITCQD